MYNAHIVPLPLLHENEELQKGRDWLPQASGSRSLQVDSTAVHEGAVEDQLFTTQVVERSDDCSRPCPKSDVQNYANIQDILTSTEQLRNVSPLLFLDLHNLTLL